MEQRLLKNSRCCFARLHKGSGMLYSKDFSVENDCYGQGFAVVENVAI